MVEIAATIASSEFEADRQAVAAVNFCSLWPAARPALQGLLGVVTNTFVKMAVSTVLAAGDAYCGTSKAASTTKQDVLDKIAGSNVKSLEDLAELIVERSGGQAMPMGSIVGKQIIWT